MKSLVQLASSDNGFGCGLGVIGDEISAYHDKGILSGFNMGKYKKGESSSATEAGDFKSPYRALGSFYASLNAHPSPDIVQVCYGGKSKTMILIVKRPTIHLIKLSHFII